MFLKKRKSLITLLIALFAAVVLALGALMFTSQQTAYAYKSSNMPTGTNAIGNIYKGNGKFDKGNLDKLAQSIKNSDGSSKYSNINYLIRFAELNGTVTSADFGDIVVNFGSYTFNGASRELTWIPAYVSKDNSGSAILTLWIANTANSNGLLSNQEVSTWSDGTYSTSATQEYNGSTIYSNTYDGSYIRNYVLNGSENYAKQWGNGTAITPPDSSTMTKFSQFVGSGELSSYIVKPRDVSWQTNEKKLKNDVGWYCTNLGDPGFNYPSKWINDNLWLPSLYEVQDNDIDDNSTATSFFENGGLWQTGDSLNRQKRSSLKVSWLRSGYYGQCDTSYVIPPDGSRSYNDTAYAEGAVRPALHLNLSAVAEAAEPATCEFPSKTDWENAFDNSNALPNRAEITEITFAKTAPDGYTDSGEKLNTNIQIWKKDDTKIAFVYDGTITAPERCYALFSNLENLTAINFDNFSTDNVTYMTFMFQSCSGLTSLDLSGFNTEKVTEMTCMFNSCHSLKTITVSDSLAGKLSQTTDNTYLYYGNRETWYDEDGKSYTNTNRFSTAGTYTTVQPPFEVMVGTAKTYYNSLPSAWNYANGATTAATVKMNADATVGETLTVATGKNITLDLNGYKITYTGASGSVVKVDGTFTLNDSNKTATNTITSPVTNQSVTIKGGVITGGKGYGSSVIGGGVFVDEDGSFTMNGGTLAGNTADFGGGVRVGTNATFIMNSGATISHNKATKNGGGICVCGATNVELKGTVSDNAAVAGGGIYYEGNGTHIISGATIKNNTVTRDSNVSYSGNGGGIYVDKCTITMSGGSISGNSTTKNGGGVYVLNGSTFEMTNGTISGNTADYYGGGVYVIGTFIMSDGTVSGNKAQDGGGVCVNGGTFTMSGGTIKGNNATIYNGGGVELTDGTFKVSGGVVIKDNVKGGTLDSSTGFYTGGTKNNVYLEIGETITVAGALTTGAIIGVYNSGDIATGYNQSEKPSVFFIPDNSANNCVYVSNANDGTVSIGTHSWNDGTVSAQPTCSTEGVKSFACTHDSTHTKTEGIAIVSTAHNYGTPSYTWSNDNTTCTAERVCLHNSSHKETETVTATSVTTVPTCTVGGYDTLTATFTNSAFATQSKQINQTNATGHAPEADDNDCTTEIKCSVCQAVTTAALSHDFSGGYLSDNTQHWHVCTHSGCTVTDTKADHSPEIDDNDCTTEIRCWVCNAVTTAANAAHNFSGAWNYDGTGHWHACKNSGCYGTEKFSHNCNQEVVDPSYIKLPASCNRKTVYYKSCECGFSDKDEAKTFEHGGYAAHTFGAWQNGAAATCSATGTKAHKDCSVCHKHFDNYNTEITDLTIAIIPTAHSYGDWSVTTPATCESAGVQTRTCAHNSAHKDTQPIPVEGHSYAETFTVDTSATCESAGSKSRHCTRQGCNSKTDVTIIPAAGHTFGEWQDGTAATCSATGTKAHKDCSVCHKHFDNTGNEIADLTVPVDSTAHGYATVWMKDESGHWHAATCAHTTEKSEFATHTAGDWITDLPAQVGVAGSRHRECTVCEYTTETAEIPAITPEHQHTFSTDWSKDESGHWHAATCGHIDETSEFAAHIAGDWITDLPAQVGVAGSRHRECTVCEYTMETAEIPALTPEHEHTFSTEWSKDGTGHWHAATCEHFGEKDDFAAHTAGEWIEDVPAQVGVAGSKHKECTVCGYTMETAGIAALVAELVKPDENGGENQVVVTTPEGFTPDIELVVTEIKQENYGAYESVAQTVNGEINLVYDVTLKSNGVTIQPDGTLTIRLRIPENLAGKDFKLFHLHEGTATDMEYTVDGNYAVVTTDKLSEFIFVGEKIAPAAFNPLWLILIIIVSLVIVGEVGYIVYRKVRKNKAAEVQE